MFFLVVSLIYSLIVNKKMRRNSHTNRSQTKFVQLDSRKCKACWNCIEKCEQKVIGKIDFLWHKHVRLRHPENCTGCRNCIKTCESGAILYIYKKTANYGEAVI